MSQRYTFSLTPTQIKCFEDWKTQFEHLSPGTVGGLFSFKFTPTSIGTSVYVTMEHGFYDNKQTAVLDLTEHSEF
jgi:hypothetical protein